MFGFASKMVKMRFLISNDSAGEITLHRRQHVAREIRVERGMAYTAPLSNSSRISHSGGRLEILPSPNIREKLRYSIHIHLGWEKQQITVFFDR